MRCPPEATGEGGATQEQGVAAEAHRHQSRRDLAAMRPGLTGATEFGDRQEQETPTGEGDRDQAGGELREISHHPPPRRPRPLTLRTQAVQPRLRLQEAAAVIAIRQPPIGQVKMLLHE